MRIIESGRSCNNCSRKNCFINKYCSEEWKSFLTDHKTSYLIEPGEKIFSKGQQVKGVYTVFSGFIKVSDFIKDREFPSNGSYPYIMNELDSLDIDTNNDLEIFMKIL